MQGGGGWNIFAEDGEGKKCAKRGDKHELPEKKAGRKKRNWKEKDLTVLKRCEGRESGELRYLPITKDSGNEGRTGGNPPRDLAETCPKVL